MADRFLLALRALLGAFLRTASREHCSFYLQPLLRLARVRLLPLDRRDSSYAHGGSIAEKRLFAALVCGHP
jgi:hypothetical protein